MGTAGISAPGDAAAPGRRRRRGLTIVRLALIAVLCAGLLVPRPASGTAHARVALIFDHAGASLAELAPIYAMHEPFGLGIFPNMRYSAEIARTAAAHGLTPILHLPLEPIHPADLGPVTGTVWVRMADAEIARMVDRDLDSVPGVVGVNNHAGSRATADRRVMTVVLRTVKARGLWFNENPETPQSVVSEVARQLDVPLVVTGTYLDIPPEHIARNVRALIAEAERRGSVVAAAHIATGAPAVIQKMLPEFRRAGIVFVPVTAFLERRAP
jgi:polysaccharide deacetylase 2 family uncharacterized protein YibQ